MPGKTNTYGVILFHTSSAVLRAEKILLKEGFSIKLIPTPREFSSDCGVALRLDWAETTRAQEILESAHVEISSVRSM
jgi:hypothetical protein